MRQVDRIPERYESTLVVWARNKAFCKDAYPKSGAQVTHPERPGEMVKLGIWINKVVAFARGTDKAKNNASLQSRYLKIAKRVREILIKEYRQLGQHDRVSKLREDWWQREEMAEAADDVTFPKKYESTLVLWARNKAFWKDTYPKEGARVTHPERPGEMVKLGIWIRTVLSFARGTAEAKNNASLQSRYIKIAKRVRDILIKEYVQLGQHDRVSKLREDWWQREEMAEAADDVTFPKKYESTLVLWARNKAFWKDTYPKEGARVTHPERPGEMVKLGIWINKVVAFARGTDKAKNNASLQSRYLKIAKRVREILIKEYRQLGQHDRVSKLREDWWQREEMAEAADDVTFPKKYESTLVLWARNKAFCKGAYPNRRARVTHPERPGEMVKLGSWIKTVLTYARGTGKAKHNASLQSRYIKIAKRVRDILIKEYVQLGQHDRVSKLREDWWKPAKQPTENQPRESTHNSTSGRQSTFFSNKINTNSEKYILPDRYAACLRVWSRIDQFQHHPYPLNGTARAIPIPDNPDVGWNLGKWVNKVLLRARGKGRAKGNMPLQQAYQHMAQAILELLTHEYALQQQWARIANLQDTWNQALKPDVPLLPSNGARQMSASRPVKRPSDDCLDMVQYGQPEPHCGRKRQARNRCE